MPLSPCITAGFLVMRDKERVVVTASVDTQLESTNDRLAIPAGWVKRISYLGEVKRGVG